MIGFDLCTSFHCSDNGNEDCADFQWRIWFRRLDLQESNRKVPDNDDEDDPMIILTTSTLHQLQYRKNIKTEKS